MILLRLISWPYLRRHLIRSVLTLAGVALGVALYVGIHAANRAVLASLSETIEKIGGAAQLQVTAGEVGFPEWVLEKVRTVKGVSTAMPVVEGTVETERKGSSRLFVRGLEVSSERSLRDYGLEGADQITMDERAVFLMRSNWLIVTEKFARRNGLKLGTELGLAGVRGSAKFVVRGIMRNSRSTRAFGGNFAFMDIHAAQRVFGRGRRFNRVEVALDKGVSPRLVRASLVAALGRGLDVDPASGRGEQLDAVLAAYKTSVGISSVLALFIGLFMIYNAFAIAVSQRRSEIGILRALGASRGQIRGLFLTEGAVTGVLGSILGLAVGAVFARGMAGSIGTMLEGVYGLPLQGTPEVSADPGLLALAVALGIATSVIAAWIPARSAARVDPVHALQKNGGEILTSGDNLAMRWWGLAAAALASLLFQFGGVRWAFYLSYGLTVTAVLFLAPTLTLWITRALRPFLSWLRPVEGALAADSLLRAPQRTSATVIAVMLSLALVIGLGGLARASHASISQWIRQALSADLLVTAARNPVEHAFNFPSSMGDELAALPGVAHVQPVRTARINYRGKPALLVAAALEDIARRAVRRTIAGDPGRMYALASHGQGAIVSQNFAQLRHMKIGDRLALPTPTGMLVLPIVGVVVDWSDPLGTIFVDRRIYVRRWEDRGVNVFNVYLNPGVDELTVRRRVITKYEGKRRIFVRTNREVRDHVIRLADQWLNIAYVQLGIAVLVAILGIANTLTVSVLDSRRELSVLRAVGAFAGQVRRAIWMEAVVIAMVGVVLGGILGALNLYYLLSVTRLDISGFSLDYQFPWILAAFLFPIMLITALGAALGPGQSAVRDSLVEGLEYE